MPSEPLLINMKSRAAVSEELLVKVAALMGWTAPVAAAYSWVLSFLNGGFFYRCVSCLYFSQFLRQEGGPGMCPSSAGEELGGLSDQKNCVFLTSLEVIYKDFCDNYAWKGLH